MRNNPEIGRFNTAPELHEDPPVDPRTRLTAEEAEYFADKSDEEVAEYLLQKEAHNLRQRLSRTLGALAAFGVMAHEAKQ